LSSIPNLTGLKGKTCMVEKMHKTTSNGIIVSTIWRDVGMEHTEQDIIKWEKIGSFSRFAPGDVE
jgi:hypothetical protein